MYSCGPLPMDEQRQDVQLKPTYSSSVPIWDKALRICWKQWMIGRRGERGSGISMLIAQHDDDDDLTVWKKVRSGSFKDVIYKLYFEITNLIFMNKKALNDLCWHGKKHSQTEINYTYVSDFFDKQEVNLKNWTIDKFHSFFFIFTACLQKTLFPSRIAIFWNILMLSQFITYKGQLKSSSANKDTLIECDQMRFIFQHSLPCSLHSSSISVAKSSTADMMLSWIF